MGKIIWFILFTDGFNSSPSQAIYANRNWHNSRINPATEPKAYKMLADSNEEPATSIQTQPMLMAEHFVFVYK